MGDRIEARTERPLRAEPRGTSAGTATLDLAGTERSELAKVLAAGAAAPRPDASASELGVRLASVTSKVRTRARVAPVRQVVEGMALLLVGVGLLLGWVVHLSWTPLIDLAMVVVGIVLIVQSRLSAPTRPLIALGVVLALVAAGTWRADTTLDGGLGRRTERPVASFGPPVTYRLGTGQLTIDLTDTAFTGQPLVIDAEVGIGRMVVDLPADAVATIRTRVGGGQSLVDEKRTIGPAIDQTGAEASAGTKVVLLDLSVGIGSVEVHRG